MTVGGRSRDPRNVIDGPAGRLLGVYLAAVSAVGAALLAVRVAGADPATLQHLEPACWVAAGLLLLGEARPLFLPGARDVNGVVLSTAFVFAMLLRYDLTVALTLQTAAVLLGDVGRGKPPWRTAFNVGQYAIAWSGAAAVMALLGHRASALHPAALQHDGLTVALVGAAVFFVLNEVLVSTAICLRTGNGVREVLRAGLLYELMVTGALLAFGPLVALSMQAGPAYVPLLLPPLAAVYAAAAVGVRSEQQSMTDVLTGLANRKRLAAQLRGEQGALVLLDLDMFKQVNDTLGHYVGDQLLVAVAQRLESCVRPGDLVVRLGGDEFALVLDGADEGAAVRAAMRAREALATPFSLSGLLVGVTASAGIALCPDHGNDVDELLQRADVAMYLSKESGEVEVYDADCDPNTPGRLVLLGALRRAIDNDELVLHYQPKADTETGRVVGLEALLRWQHPELGLVAASEFIPLAERSGLVVPLTRWLVSRAVRQLAEWRRRNWELCLAVNITVKDLCSEGFVEHVEAALAETGVNAECLQLELTESSLFADSAPARDALRRLLGIGVSLSLDDFGTGWSSLGQLRQLPVREIKIDRSFVAGMTRDRLDQAIVASVVKLGRGLGVRVVAEGVEDDDTWRLLADLGCDRVQGWALCAPLPAAAMQDWLVARMGVSVEG